MPVPDFSPGEVLTAAAMDSIGLWLVKTQTIGTGVSSVTVTGAFSADYDDYYVTITGGVGSATIELALTMGSTATGYLSSIGYSLYASNTASGIAGGTVSVPYAGTADVNRIHMGMRISNPFAAKHTLFHGEFINVDAQGTVGGRLANTTSYTAFTLTCSSFQTITGGTIRIYGYRK